MNAKAITIELPAWNAQEAQSHLDLFSTCNFVQHVRSSIHHALDIALLIHALECGANAKIKHLREACSKVPEIIELMLKQGVVPDSQCLMSVLHDGDLTEKIILSGAEITDYAWQRGLLNRNDAIIERYALLSSETQVKIATKALGRSDTLETIRYLVEQWGANPSGSELFDRCQRGHDEIACYMVEQGGDYLFRERDGGWSARAWATHNGLSMTTAAIARMERTKKLHGRLERQANRTRKKLVEQPAERRAM